MSDNYGTQKFHKLAKPVGEGTDEHGHYLEIPLSMVRGGKTKPYKVYTEPIKHIRRDTSPAPRGWYKPKNPDSDRVRPRPCFAEALLTTPYGGFCPVNCAHCYVNNGTRGYRATGLPVAHYAYPETMRMQLPKLMVSGAAYITSFTEPFHPLEPDYHITQELAELFNEEGLPIFFLSRKLLPEWGLEALKQNPYSYMQWSINTSNPDHYHRFSPGSFELEDVYENIRHVHDNGVYVSIQCNPVIPGITSLEEVVDLVYILAEYGADHVIFKFVEQVANNRSVIVDRMRQRGLPNVDKFDELFSQVIGGVYTIKEKVRVEWLNVLLEETREAGITMSLCYEYMDDGKAGENMAPFYTTARGGCHGKVAPVHYRPEPGAKFRPIPGCFESGCLYCADVGTRACGNELLLRAEALKYKHLRTTNVDVDEGNWELDCSAPRPSQVQNYNNWYPGKSTFSEQFGWELLIES